MNSATTHENPRRRRVLIAVIAGGLVLLLMVGVGIYGLVRGPAASPEPAPSERPSATSEASAGPTTSDGPSPVPQLGGPAAFVRAASEALFSWDTASGYGPSDYAQVLADVAADAEADALVNDVRSYLPSTEAWAQLRGYATRQWLTIDEVFVPATWHTAVEQAAPGQIPEGTTAYTVIGTRHRDSTWGTQPVQASRPVSFTVFVVCTSPIPGHGATGVCELLRLSELDNPMR
jgi:hypothetical protein